MSKGKEKRDQTWGIARKRKSQNAWEKYVKMRNKYTKIRRQEARQYEKNIALKSGSDPKMFYRHVNIIYIDPPM